MPMIALFHHLLYSLCTYFFKNSNSIDNNKWGWKILAWLVGANILFLQRLHNTFLGYVPPVEAGLLCRGHHHQHLQSLQVPHHGRVHETRIHQGMSNWKELNDMFESVIVCVSILIFVTWRIRKLGHKKGPAFCVKQSLIQITVMSLNLHRICSITICKGDRSNSQADSPGNLFIAPINR